MHPILTQLRDAEYEAAGAGWIVEIDHVPVGPTAAGTSGPRTRPTNDALYTLPFQIRDDDGELYYTGRCIDDDEAVSQSAALEWAAAFAGATTIKVLRSGAWVQEIG